MNPADSQTPEWETPDSTSATATAEPPVGDDGERRAPVERRLRRTPMFSRYTFFGGRRRGGRREEEARGIYVDRYSWGIVTLFLLILALNVLDAYFTLVYVQMGGKEANPIAQAFLDMGEIPFILVKSAVIGICLLVLVIHKTFYSVPRVLMVICIFYSLLLFYHLALQVLVLPTMV
jgi:hypothetical protein